MRDRLLARLTGAAAPPGGVHGCGWSVVLALTLTALVAGCGDDGRPASDRLATQAPAVSQDTTLDARSDAVLTHLRPDQPGCSAAVGKDGKVVWAGVRGLADTATGAPLTADTVFDIASVSKQFTAVAILLLAADGRLSIEDSVSEHVPGLPDWGRRVTINQMLHHTSGIPELIQAMSGRGFLLAQRATHADELKTVAEMEALEFEPGSKWSYSNSNYLLLGDIVQTVSGVPLAQFLRKRIFDPLGLRMVLESTGKVSGKATSYDAAAVSLRPVTSGWDTAGPGGIQSTMGELVRWGDNYRTGTVGGQRLLDAQLAGPADTPLTELKLGISRRSGPDLNYGAGIVIAEDGTLLHNGSWLGFNTWFVVSPDRHTSLAVSCNSMALDPGTLMVELREIWT